jgi:hypothetical protein
MAENAPAKPDTPKSGKVLSKGLFERFMETLEMQAELDSSEFNAKEITANVAEAMFAAGSVEEMLALQDAGLPSGKSMVDIEHEIVDFETVKGDPKYEDNSLGYYYRIHGNMLSDGSEILYACGAPNIMVAIANLRQRDALPFKGVIRSRSTANGDLLTLRAVPPRAL